MECLAHKPCLAAICAHPKPVAMGLKTSITPNLSAIIISPTHPLYAPFRQSHTSMGGIFVLTTLIP